MPNIPFPDVPEYPGVPALSRSVEVAIARYPALSIGIGTLETLLISALREAPRWGIFDSYGVQLGLEHNGGNRGGILSAISDQVTGSKPTVLSTLTFDYVRESRISDFPKEMGSFASYNKVQTPANPVVSLSLDGSDDDRTHFLTALDAACITTDLFTVVTPEIVYADYSIERYNYRRTASQGVTLLIVDVSLKEVRQVQASHITVTNPIVSPQNPASTPSVDNGITQAPPVDTSKLKSILDKIGAFGKANQ